MTLEVVSLGCRLNLSESEDLRRILAGEQDLVVDALPPVVVVAGPFQCGGPTGQGRAVQPGAVAAERQAAVAVKPES